MIQSKDRGGDSLELLEEAVHLLRRMPMAVLSLYFYGAFPLMLGFLYFWTDMSRGPFAHTHLTEAAFGVSLLYIWMKCWQSVFCSRIYDHLVGQPAESFSWPRTWRLITLQTIIQPFRFFVMPVAFLLLLPFGWIFAFFRNVLVIGNGRDSDLRSVIRSSWRLAQLWPGQNHRLILVVALFALVVFINFGVALILIPQLIRMLFGIETIFTLSGLHIFNTTFIAITAACTYLCIDPLLSVAYTLRCFYGEAIKTGADLLAELRSAAER